MVSPRDGQSPGMVSTHQPGRAMCPIPGTLFLQQSSPTPARCAQAGSILQNSPATASLPALLGHKGPILWGDVTLPRSAQRSHPGGSAGAAGRPSLVL